MSVTADTSAGYAGRVSEVTWAALEEFSGDGYSVNGDGDLKTTAAGTGDRPLTVAAGSAFGRGVYDTWSGSTILNADSVSSGVRWDTLVITRTWGVGNRTSVLTINKGTSAQAVTITNSTPGTIDDQPLYLFKVTAGSTVISNLIDLRAWPSKISAYATKLALPAAARLGAQALTMDTGHSWMVELVGSTPTWIDQDLPPLVNFPLVGPSLIAAVVAPQYRVSRGHFTGRGGIGRAGGLPLIASSYRTDGTQDPILGTLAAGARPGSSRFYNVPELGGTGYARLQVGPDGTVLVKADGKTINAVAIDGVHFDADQ